MAKHKVQVVIPLYSESLSSEDLRLLRHNVKVLHSYPVVFVLPESMDDAWYAAQDLLGVYDSVRVPDAWLGRHTGKVGYNRMMLSAAFYRLFDAEYILMCQVDAYVFRDELLEWCDKDYDYVGAPWVKSPKYLLPGFKQYHQYCRSRKRSTIDFKRHHLFGCVGNGGFSLRKVESMIRAAEEYKDVADYYLTRSGHLYNEDVFWSMIPHWFRYPRFREALQFSFDVKPRESLRLNNGCLPFGCHGLTKKRYRSFWQRFVLLM